MLHGELIRIRYILIVIRSFDSASFLLSRILKRLRSKIIRDDDRD